jgi:hypothetical protein
MLFFDKSNNKIAPTVAITIDPINSPAEIPRKPNILPPIVEPITPITIFSSKLNLLPFIIVAAKQPTMAPINKTTINPVTLIT